MINLLKAKAPLKFLCLIVLGTFVFASIHCGVKGRPQVPEYPPFIGRGLLHSERAVPLPASKPLPKSTPQSGKTN